MKFPFQTTEGTCLHSRHKAAHPRLLDARLSWPGWKAETGTEFGIGSELSQGFLFLFMLINFFLLNHSESFFLFMSSQFYISPLFFFEHMNRCETGINWIYIVMKSMCLQSCLVESMSEYTIQASANVLVPDEDSWKLLSIDLLSIIRSFSIYVYLLFIFF